jgi:hypothetical protein
MVDIYTKKRQQARKKMELMDFFSGIIFLWRQNGLSLLITAPIKARAAVEIVPDVCQLYS